MIPGLALFLAGVAVAVVERATSRKREREAFKRGEFIGTKKTTKYMSKPTLSATIP